MLNDFLYKVATGEVPNPYKAKAEEDELMTEAIKRKTQERSFGKTLSAKNLGISEAELGAGSLAKVKGKDKGKSKGDKGKGKGKGRWQWTDYPPNHQEGDEEKA